MTETSDTTDATELARSYYDAIDAGDYDRFADLLGAGVVHERPDRTIEDRDALVGFMRDDRPNKDTSHEIEAVFAEEQAGEDAPEVAVRGRLRDAEGNPMFEFVDAFEFESGEARIARIRTYTR
ncbi:nuclear transport factor 2 family protein [Halorussus lipolyticus]|uniref:nuclear transport factor 2 family protein n=1 Tax=Halorussus lipolyticus TaxID=3034024 RepID=UPI0023E8A608|nr:nuclear transport factor 2 family protein [Halorussus sp. DT80]